MPYHYHEPTEKITNPCAAEGCPHAGEHKAPLPPPRSGEYQWLCLDHVREFNKAWDFFKGRSQEEIEAFQKDALFGHRPTWKINEADKFTPAALQEALGKFTGFSYRTFTPVKPLCPKNRKALEVLDLPHPSEKVAIKKQYKKLVKRYHPDVNQGDAMAAEKFKQVTAAYNHLIKHYCEDI